MSLRDLKMRDTGPLHWTGFDSLSPISDPFQQRHSREGIAQSGMSAHTRVDTLRGPVAARDLQTGDQVKIFGDGYATLRWVGNSRPEMGHEQPLRRVDLDGNQGSTILTPDSLVLVEHLRNELLFGTDVVLCPARYLLDAGMFVEDASVNPVFVHLLFDTCELVKCGDDWVESLLPDMEQIRANDLDAAHEIVSLLPRLANQHGMAAYVQNHPVLDEREAKVLFS